MDIALTGWEGGSWLPARTTAVTTFLCHVKMLLAEIWNPWPSFLPFVLLREDPQVTPWPRAAVEMMLCVLPVALSEFISQRIL